MMNNQKPFSGIVADYHDNGQLKNKFTVKNGKIPGTPKEYSKNGRLLTKGHYRNGVEDGIHERLHSNNF